MSNIIEDAPPYNKLDGIWTGEFAKDVANVNDPAFVFVESFGHEYEIGPCRWQTRGGALPEKGMDCLVGYDENEIPYVITWWDGTSGTVIPPGSITPAMIAPGNNGDTLETIGGAVTWVKNCKARANRASQTLNHAAHTAFVFDVEVYDTDNMVNVGGANPSRIVCNTDGMYLCTASVSFPPAGAGPRIVYPRKNTAVVFNFQQGAAVPVPDNSVVTTMDVIPMVVNDYVECIGYQTSGGGNLAGCGANMSVMRIGP